MAHTRSDCGNFATHPLELDNEEAQLHKDTQHMNTCTALYELRIRSVNKVEALTLSLGKSHDKKFAHHYMKLYGIALDGD